MLTYRPLADDQELSKVNNHLPITLSVGVLDFISKELRSFIETSAFSVSISTFDVSLAVNHYSMNSNLSKMIIKNHCQNHQALVVITSALDETFISAITSYLPASEKANIYFVETTEPKDNKQLNPLLSEKLGRRPFTRIVMSANETKNLRPILVQVAETMSTEAIKLRRKKLLINAIDDHIHDTPTLLGCFACLYAKDNEKVEALKTLKQLVELAPKGSRFSEILHKWKQSKTSEDANAEKNSLLNQTYEVIIKKPSKWLFFLGETTSEVDRFIDGLEREYGRLKL